MNLLSTLVLNLKQCNVTRLLTIQRGQFVLIDLDKFAFGLKLLLEFRVLFEFYYDPRGSYTFQVSLRLLSKSKG